MAKKKNKKRADGRYAVQVYLGLDENKKRKYKTVYGNTQKEADKKALELKLQLKKGIDISSENDAFGVWADRWLNMKKNNVSYSQYTVYRSCLKHLNNELINIPISKIQLYQLQAVIDNLSIRNPNTKKPSSKKTLKAVKLTASQIFDFAIRNRVIDYNPVKYLDIPQNAPQTHRRALTDEEIRWIENTAHRAQLPAMIMLYAGLRRGEVLALAWNDIDFENKTISVNKAIEYIGDNPRFKSTKTKSGLRTIPIPNILVDFLKQQPKISLYVCPNSQGNLCSKSSWRKLWNSYLLELDAKYGKSQKKSKFDSRYKGISIEKFTAHYLRHTYATMLYKAGVDVLTAQYLLGHADINTTLSIYTHLDNEFKQKSINDLNNYIDNKKCKSDASQM